MNKDLIDFPATYKTVVLPGFDRTGPVLNMELSRFHYYLYDIGIQHRVVTDNGLRVSSASLMHLNKNYVYDGSTYDLHRLFTIEDQTAGVKSLKNELGKRLQEQFTMLKRSKPPDITAGPQCTDPLQCEFYDDCNPPLADDHVSFLPGISAKMVARLAVSVRHRVRDTAESMDAETRRLPR